MGDGRQEFLAVGNGAGLCPADVSLGIMGVQAKLCSDLQTLVQGGAGTLAKRSARFRSTLNAGNGADPGDVTQDRVTVGFCKGVNGRPTGIVHGKTS